MSPPTSHKPPGDGGRQVSPILLLSHMRAFTSLLGHILGSHPEIDGYYELHHSYTLAGDLDRQWARYVAGDSPKAISRYLFDKLLHNDYTVDPDLPELRGAILLIALRPPEPTLQSIVRLFAAKSGARHPYASPAGATGYYCERLAALAAFAERHSGRYRYFDAPLVRDDPSRLLAALAAWLALHTPLPERYRTFSQTGVAGAGDSSPALAAGRILETTPAQPGIDLDPALLAQAQDVYRQCRARLIANANASVLS